MGGEFPRRERLSVAQVSAIRGRLIEDRNPAPDFGCFGTLGERADKATAGMPDIKAGGERRRRRFRGPDRFRDWRAGWRVFRAAMLVCDACPPGPLDAYEKNMEILSQRFPGRSAILAKVDGCMRFEEWQRYRDEIEEMVLRGFPPKCWDRDRPWAAVIWWAARDRHY